MPKSRKSFKVAVSPAVMKWAIENSGWKDDELAERLKVSKSTLDAWQSGDAAPSFNQLEHLATSLKRPVAALLLPKPPEERPHPPDFRMLPGKTGRFEKETIFAMRKARRLQQASRELMKNIDISWAPQIKRVSTTSDPLRIANEFRSEMGITEEMQRKWKDSYDAFKKLRHAIESRNILVFQMKMPAGDARGFALIDEMPATIVISSSDQIEARIFTLIHEYGHILTNQSGIDMGGQTFVDRKEIAIEKWCNDFASEFLLPKEIFLRTLGNVSRGRYDEDRIRDISKQYKVSKLMLMTKMLKLNILDKHSYLQIREELEAKGIRKKEKGFAQSSETRCLNEKGDRFISLVRDNIQRGEIGYYDAIDLLSVKVNVVDKVLGKATG